MTVATAADLKTELACSICMQIFRDPVTLACGHTFCNSCTFDCQEAREYSCPECLGRYRNRSELKRNSRTCNLAIALLPTQSELEETGMFCTYCDFALPAVKYCLQCEMSMCANRLDKHNRLVGHILLPPTVDLERRRCSVHNKILEYFCVMDSTNICATCFISGEHQGEVNG